MFKVFGCYAPALVLLSTCNGPRLVLGNHCPVAKNDLWAVLEDTPTDLTPIINNDIDLDGDPLSIIEVTQPPNATVVLGVDGEKVTFTPDKDYNGVQGFDYTITDEECTSTADVFVIVRSVNDIPIARADYEDTEQGVPVEIAVLNNDFDVDLGDSLTILAIATPPMNGVAIISDDGKTITYTPDADFSGQDIFEYTITDGQTVASALVSIKVFPKKPKKPVVLVKDPSQLCGRTLKSDTEYYLENDIVCPDGVRGPTLRDNSLLDCHGRSLVGTTRTSGDPGIGMFGTGSEVFDCRVTGFYTAIWTLGRNNIVRNVNLNVFRYGISNSGPGNAIYCSLISGGQHSFGISSIESFLVSGIYMSGFGRAISVRSSSVTIKCAQLEDTGGIEFNDGRGGWVIEESIVKDSAFFGIAASRSQNMTISNVSFCGSASYDIQVQSIDQLSSTGLTCDRSHGSVSCGSPCPLDEELSLPSACWVTCVGYGVDTIRIFQQ